MPHNAETSDSPRITVTMNNIHPSQRQSPSYSRACPVILSHPSTRESLLGLAIIDDQAAMTFVDPMVKNALKLSQESMEPSMLSTLTIEGESAVKPCHFINDLVVTPLDGQTKITLPTAIMQNKIPDARDQVPSQKEVANTPGLEVFAYHFKNNKKHVPTILLFGRNCMMAQRQEQYYNAQSSDHIISQTPLDGL